jgi:hypothetical protein
VLGHDRQSSGEPIVAIWSISGGRCASILLVDRVGEERDEIKHMLKVSRAGPGDRKKAGLQSLISILMDNVALYPMRYMTTLRQMGADQYPLL